jgi:dipeptidase E
MKLLLTSGGVTNDSIRAALEEMLGKPIADSSALFVPTAQWGQPMCSPESVWRSTSGRWPGGIHSPVELGWRSVGTLELTALPTIDPDRWMPWVRRPMRCSSTVARRCTWRSGSAGRVWPI